jgi:hypothetical protein
MPQTAYVYVPLPSKGNLEIGLQDGLWGWKKSTLDRSGNRGVVASLQAGDFLLLGYGGPNSRVAPGGWQHEHIKRVIVGQVISPIYTSTSVVCPDDIYTERIGLEILCDYPDVSGLSPEGMEALRLSANKQGAAVKDPGTEALFALAATGPREDGTLTSEADGAEAETDALRSVFVRKEQARLRRQKFGGAEEIVCAICRRTLPARIVHAAHIKRRAAASYTERMDLANIMGACTLGCDSLFEFGFIYVDRDGFIRVGPAAPPALAEVASDLAGEHCDAFCQASADYFEYHRAEIANVG